jgi:hypothetical protein
MIRRVLIAMTLSASVLLLFPCEAAAGGCFSQRQGNIKVRFEKLNEHPNFTFHLKCASHRSIDGHPHSRLVKSGFTSAIHGWGSEPGPVFLVAVPRGEMLPGPDEVANPQAWLREELPGTLQSAPLPGIDGDLSAADDRSELEYRVRIVNNVLSVELVDVQRPPNYLLGMWIVGAVFLSAALVVFTVAVLRQLRPYTPPAAHGRR